MEFQEKKYTDIIPHHTEYLIGADIGGTNANFGFFVTTDIGLKLVFSIHYKSQTITNFTEVMVHLLGYVKTTYDITPKKICIAAAGVVAEERDSVKPTNLNFVIQSADIFANTDLSCIYLVNDFEIIGHGIDTLPPEAFLVINKGCKRIKANRAIIGAGTGLGKCISVWNNRYARHIPCPSEGGHADVVIHTAAELELIEFLKSRKQQTNPLSWEDILSGNGIQHMHTFFMFKSGHPEPPIPPHPDEIFKNRDQDSFKRSVLELYLTFYARCAKNFALDALALNGVYIAGGIAAHNAPMFQMHIFLKEFFKCAKHSALLKDIPVTIITDYNVSLYGAAQYMILEEICK
jgi:glucokinase